MLLLVRLLLLIRNVFLSSNVNDFISADLLVSRGGLLLFLLLDLQQIAADSERKVELKKENDIMSFTRSNLETLNKIPLP